MVALASRVVQKFKVTVTPPKQKRGVRGYHITLAHLEGPYICRSVGNQQATKSIRKNRRTNRRCGVSRPTSFFHTFTYNSQDESQLFQSSKQSIGEARKKSKQTQIGRYGHTVTQSLEIMTAKTTDTLKQYYTPTIKSPTIQETVTHRKKGVRCISFKAGTPIPPLCAAAAAAVGE